MEPNKVFSILFLFVQFFIFYSQQSCDNMKDRHPYSTSPITEISFIPSDDTFPTGTLFTIICTGKKTESPWAQNEYSYPHEIRMYLNKTFQGDLCRFASNDTTPVKTCVLKVNRIEPNTLSASCQVSNAYGCSYHKTIVLIKAKQKPYLSQQPPGNILVTEGQDLNITCSSPVVPRPFITWYKDDVIIPSNKTTWYRGTSVLMLKSIGTSSQGTYICIANNSLGEISSNGSVLIAKQKPYLSQQPPRDIQATEGQDLNITCSSPVVPRPFTTWYKDDVIIPSNKTTWYRGTSVLMLKSIDMSAQGIYVCKANNSLGEISSNGSFLTVFSRPRISLPPVNQAVVIGNKVSMVCNVTGLPIPLIGWLKDGVVLGSGNGSDNETGSRMTDVVNTMASVALSSTPGFIYTRGNDVTKNSSPSLSPTSTLTRPIPSLTSTLTILTPQVTHGITRTIPFSTSTITRPIPPSATTTKPNPPTPRPFSGKMTQIGRHSTLVIESVTKDDEGKYQCYAKNAIGNATSRHATLFVYIPEKSEKPRFTESPRNVSVLAGFNSTMSCSAAGRPRPNITWYKNMLPIIEGNKMSVVANGNASVLMVTYVRLGDEGEYRCKAENSAGIEYSRQAFLDVKDVYQPKAFNSGRGISPLIPILGTLLPVLLVVMVILIILINKNRRKLRHQQTTKLALSTSIVSQAQKDVEGIRNEGTNEEEFHDDAVYLLLMGIDRDWEISRDRLILTNQRLGVGCFGQVDKGIYTRKDSKEMFVAVKTLKEPGVHTHQEDILAELDMLKRVGRHPNVVSLIGACTRNDPLCIIIEFVDGGSLNELLIKARLPANTEPYENIRSRLTERDLVKIAADIARGMRHLHDKNCIHRDLAARNILIGPGLVAKISDFGLARHVIDGFYVKQSSGKVPWKWLSPEALQGLFTTKSDVWSFGILLWENATLGHTPYPAITQLVVLYNLLSNGFRMPKPDYCHDMLYSLMMDCWSADSNKRPGFADIYKMLEKILNQKERIYINLEEMYQVELEHQF